MLTEYDAYFQRRWAALTENMDQNLVKLIPDQWRSDAKFFLIGNVNAMVVAPYMTVNTVEGPLSTSTIWRDLSDDVRNIVARAGQIALRRGRAYVSGTSVAMALGELAPHLKVTSFQIWGPPPTSR